jgi:hypothetical protein
MIHQRPRLKLAQVHRIGDQRSRFNYSPISSHPHNIKSTINTRPSERVQLLLILPEHARSNGPGRVSYPRPNDDGGKQDSRGGEPCTRDGVTPTSEYRVTSTRESRTGCGCTDRVPWRRELRASYRAIVRRKPCPR